VAILLLIIGVKLIGDAISGFSSSPSMRLTVFESPSGCRLPGSSHREVPGRRAAE
jgi:hypothetical protein